MVILYLDTNDPFWPEESQKIWYIKEQSYFLWPSSFTVKGWMFNIHHLHTYFSPSFIFTSYSLSLFLDLLPLPLLHLHQKSGIMPSTQALPFINPGLQSDYYRTILPNISYPYCPNSHILCSGSLAPLRLHSSVSQAFFFMFCDRLTPFALRKPCILRSHLPLSLPVNMYVSHTFFNMIISNVNSSLISGSYHCEYIFPWNQHVSSRM